MEEMRAVRLDPRPAQNKVLRECWGVVQVFLMFGWMLLVWCADVNALSQAYKVCGIVGLVCMWHNYNRKSPAVYPRKTVAALAVLALLFSGAVCLANYPIFDRSSNILYVLTKILICTMGGWLIGWHILVCAMNAFPIQADSENRNHPIRFFFICFVLSSVIFLSYLFSVAYPGYFTADTQMAFADILSGTYRRVLPVWHTLFIDLCLNIGYLFGGTGNSALVVYPIVQSIAMAAVCSYALVTMYEVGVPKWCIWVCFFVYSVFPYNIVYSVMIWKDIPFSLGAFAMALALYRIMKQIGRQWGNYLVFCMSSFAFCLSRTNGWYSFVAIMLLVVIASWKKCKKLLLWGAVIWIVTGVMLHPVLDRIAPGETSYLEPMGIPFQQIARVVSTGYSMPEADYALLARVFDLDKMCEVYDPGFVDPIKNLCFDWTQYDFFVEHLGDYASLWLRWGLRYPGAYLKAWVDATKGYWNAGYAYWIYFTDASYEPLGIVREVYNNPLARFYKQLFSFVEFTNLYREVFCAIGVNVWVMFGCMAINALKKRKAWMIGIPATVIIVGLWLCTPVYSEFRYAYAVFLTVPFLFTQTAFQNKEKALLD